MASGHTELAAHLFRLYKAELERSLGRQVLNRELAHWLEIHEVTASELLNGNRKKVEIAWLVRIMLQLPPERRYVPFDSLLEVEKENKLWNAICALGESCACTEQDQDRFIAPNLRLSRKNGHYYVVRQDKAIKIGPEKALQLLDYLASSTEDSGRDSSSC